ncbi:hypothetical protein [Candidatus Halobonum tyrrellensis]|uniref:hypothetical protein n=1 Tax=Candidatus Halobonum tyrrellensis TaxID=1431545 RepID=UPI000677E855|nr:hypothetical protein [Candidatus Halobonum tyrrellensis]
MSAITNAGGAEAIEEPLSDREIRALTERLVVLDRGAPGLFTVFSEEGTEYTVDIHDGGACTCNAGGVTATVSFDRRQHRIPAVSGTWQGRSPTTSR